MAPEQPADAEQSPGYGRLPVEGQPPDGWPQWDEQLSPEEEQLLEEEQLQDERQRSG